MTPSENPSTADLLRVLVDANLLVAGIGWPRIPYAMLQHAIEEDYRLVLTKQIIFEAEQALNRIFRSTENKLTPFLTNTSHELVETPSDEMIQEHHWLSRDPKDIHVALAAMNARVDILVTQDKDLTAPDAPIRAHVTVMLPAQFLRQIMGYSSDAIEVIRKRNWSDLDL
jgi:putative PIN family toxin of toxin-antitoxin system